MRLEMKIQVFIACLIVLSFFTNVVNYEIMINIDSKFPAQNSSLAILAEPKNNTAFYISDFTEDILLSTSDFYNHHATTTMAISDDDTIFVGWKNAEVHNGPGLRVSFTKSSDNGATWSNPVYIPRFDDAYSSMQSDPWLVWHEGTLYYAYVEYTSILPPWDLTQITVSKSDNDGEIWTAIQASESEGFADKETLTIQNDGIIFVVYDDASFHQDSLSMVIRLSKSSDSGETYQETGVVADNDTYPGLYVAPFVLTDPSSNVYTGWTWHKDRSSSSRIFGDPYLSISQNQGETFSSAINMNPTSDSSSMGTVAEAFENRPARAAWLVLTFDENINRLYALWAEKLNASDKWGVYLRYSDDSGIIWSDLIQINLETEGEPLQPNMDIDSQGRLHIAWYNEQAGYFSPYYRTILFEGEEHTNLIMSELIAITPNKTTSSFTRPGDYLAIKVDSKDVPHIVWTDGRNGALDVYYSNGILTSTPTKTTPTKTTPTKTSKINNWLPIVIFAVLPIYFIRRKMTKRN